MENPALTMKKGKEDKAPKPEVLKKPSGALSPYGVFSKWFRQHLSSKENPNGLSFGEFSQRCAEVWKTMVPAQKTQFEILAAMDKERYKKEMTDYEAAVQAQPEIKKKRKNKKRVKDPNAPKRNLTAFFWFCGEFRPILKSKNPDLGVGEIAKALGRLWQQMNTEQRAKYQLMADRDAQRYREEMEEYIQRIGETGVVPEQEQQQESFVGNQQEPEEPPAKQRRVYKSKKTAVDVAAAAAVSASAVPLGRGKGKGGRNGGNAAEGKAMELQQEM